MKLLIGVTVIVITGVGVSLSGSGVSGCGVLVAQAGVLTLTSLPSLQRLGTLTIDPQGVVGLKLGPLVQVPTQVTRQGPTPVKFPIQFG